MSLGAAAKFKNKIDEKPRLACKVVRCVFNVVCAYIVNLCWLLRSLDFNVVLREFLKRCQS